MADVLVVCRNCGKEHTVSEYASGDTLFCVQCQRPLALPTGEKRSKLAIRKTDETEHLTAHVLGRPVVPPPPPLANQTVDKLTAINRVHVVRNKIRAPRSIWAVLSFLVCATVLLGLQYYGLDQRPELLQYYGWTRAGLGGLVFLLTVMTAFEENIFQGIFALLFLPYTVYYAFVRTDSYLLRGAAFAVMLSIAAEVYFLGDNALLVVVQNAVNRFVQGGSDLIDRAANEPVF